MFAKAWRLLMMEENGEDLIEWAILAAFIAIVITLVLFMFRYPILNFYQAVIDNLNFANDQLLPAP